MASMREATSPEPGWTPMVINTRTNAISTIAVGQDPSDVAISGWIDE